MSPAEVILFAIVGSLIVVAVVVLIWAIYRLCVDDNVNDISYPRYHDCECYGSSLVNFPSQNEGQTMSLNPPTYQMCMEMDRLQDNSITSMYFISEKN